MAKKRRFRFGSVVIESNVKQGFLLTEKPNTEGGSVTQNTVNYIDTDGASYSDIYFAPRSFDIKGAILFDSESEKFALKHRLIASCNPKKETELFYYNGHGNYYALALPQALPDFGEEMNGILPFGISMVLPGFYWLSESDVKHNIFKRTKNIRGTFTLPHVLSFRTNTTNVINSGDVPAPPLFEMTCNEESEDLNEITIQNHTTKQFIRLAYTAAKGERIFVDCDACTVTSSVSGNIIDCMTADSDFFLYAIGANTIECTAANLVITSAHKNRHLGV